MLGSFEILCREICDFQGIGHLDNGPELKLQLRTSSPSVLIIPISHGPDPVLNLGYNDPQCLLKESKAST